MPDNDTEKDTTPQSIELISKIDTTGLDADLTHVFLDLNIGTVINWVERCRSPRMYLSLKLVRDAIMELDINAIEQLIRRVDGLAPDEDKRDGCANIIGDALEDVLNYGDIDQIRAFDFEAPVVIMIARALYIIAASDILPSDIQGRKDRAKAMDIIFQRTGGRKVGPTKTLDTKHYVDPDWMTQLPEGDQSC